MTNEKMVERIKLLENTINKIAENAVLAKSCIITMSSIEELEDSITLGMAETSSRNIVDRLKEIGAVSCGGSPSPISSIVKINDDPNNFVIDDKLVSNLSSTLVFIEDAMCWAEVNDDPNQIANIIDSLKVAIKLLTSVTVKMLKEGETNNVTSVKAHARN